MVRYLHPPPSLLFGPLAKPARVRSIRPYQLQPRQPWLLVQQPPPTVPVGEVGAVDPCGQHQPAGVHEQVALTPGYALRAVVTSLGSAHWGGLHHLAVDHGRTGIPVASLRLAQLLAQAIVGPPQPSVAPPAAPEVVVDRLPRRVLSRQHPPRAAAPEQVEDGVRNPA